MKHLRFLLAFIAILFISACGGGGSSDPSGSNSSSTTSGGGDYLRTTGTTAMHLNGASSYWCSWADCPSGVTCGVKIYGKDLGSTQEWQIPNGGGTFLTDVFVVTKTNPGFSLTYQGSRVGDYLPASSWANATQGDQGYCSGTTTAPITTPTPTPTPTTGQIAVWTSRSTTQTGSTSVTIDNVYAGSLTQYHTSTPTCGASATVTKTLSIGTHTFSAADGTLSWGPSSFTITAGGCLMYQIQ